MDFSNIKKKTNVFGSKYISILKQNGNIWEYLKQKKQDKPNDCILSLILCKNIPFRKTFW